MGDDKKTPKELKDVIAKELEEGAQQELPEEMKEDLEKQAVEFDALQEKIMETIGKLMEGEGIESCVFACVPPKVGMPILYWRGDEINAVRLTNIIKEALMRQISERMKP